MQFRVLRSSLDGISGGESVFTAIDDVLRQVSYFKGWSSLNQLHASILKWAATANPGDVYCTQVTAIVAVAVNSLSRADDVCHHCGREEGLDYGDLDPVEAGDIEQVVECPGCGERWMDVFALVEQRALCRNDCQLGT